MLHPRHQVSPLLLGEGAPLRHVRAVQAACDGVEKVLIGGQSAGWGRAALEYGQLKVARLGIDPGEAFTVTIPQFAVADHTVAAIISLGVLGMADNASRMGFHADACLQIS